MYDTVVLYFRKVKVKAVQLHEAQEKAFDLARDEFIVLAEALGIVPPVVHPARLDVQPREDAYISLRGPSFYVTATTDGPAGQTLDLHGEYASPLVHTRTSLPLVEAGDIITAGQIRSALGAMMTTVFASEEYLAWRMTAYGEEVV